MCLGGPSRGGVRNYRVDASLHGTALVEQVGRDLSLGPRAVRGGGDETYPKYTEHRCGGHRDYPSPYGVTRVVVGADCRTKLRQRASLGVLHKPVHLRDSTREWCAYYGHNLEFLWHDRPAPCQAKGGVT
jgi:hypothetical protein